MCCFVRRYEQRFDADAYHGDDDGTVFVHDHTLVGVGVFFFFFVFFDCFLFVARCAVRGFMSFALSFSRRILFDLYGNTTNAYQKKGRKKSRRVLARVRVLAK